MFGKVWIKGVRPCHLIDFPSSSVRCEGYSSNGGSFGGRFEIEDRNGPLAELIATKLCNYTGWASTTRSSFSERALKELCGPWSVRE